MQLSRTEDEKKLYFQEERGTKRECEGGRDGKMGGSKKLICFTYVHVSEASIL